MLIVVFRWRKLDYYKNSHVQLYVLKCVSSFGTIRPRARLLCSDALSRTDASADAKKQSQTFVQLAHGLVSSRVNDGRLKKVVNNNLRRCIESRQGCSSSLRNRYSAPFYAPVPRHRASHHWHCQCDDAAITGQLEVSCPSVRAIIKLARATQRKDATDATRIRYRRLQREPHVIIACLMQSRSQL